MKHVLLAALVALAGPPQQPAVKAKQDVVYGMVAGAGLLADIAWPEGSGPFPAIISIHGGRWVGGHRKDHSAIKVAEWAGLGFFSMSISYRLTGCTPAPACYQDMLCAIRWVRAHAAEYGIDPDRIFLIGQSAGGQMASLAATLGEGPFKRTGGWNDQSCEVRGVISVCAPYDLNTLDWGKLWTPPGEDVEAARKLASPIHHLSGKVKPILIIHSDDDRSVPIRQAVEMAEALEKAGARHKFLHYKDKGHMGIADYVVRESAAFIKEVSLP
jgi:acetyl esterase/lipase